jgi:pyruvate dehydrogenase E1 component alpha subunit
VDGNDVLAVYKATRRAAEECRRGAGPVLLELLTYRRTGHSRRDPCHYQPKDERELWASKDPIDRFGQVLIDRHVATESRLAEIRDEVVAQFKASVERAKREPQPDAAVDLTTDVFA